MPEDFQRIIKEMSGEKNLEIIEYINKGEGLTKFYNRALDETSNNIVLFIHNDIDILTKNFVKKIIKHFDNNPEYGIVGVAGSKNIPTSGKWWENPNKMYGKVHHTHEGKTWLSEYSSDQQDRLVETVLVDGLFFAVHKKRIKERFNPDVKGFHFYDVDFCTANHIAGVKIGVCTNIKVNHHSIGITNDEWERNRVEYSERYASKLPLNVKKTFAPNEKIKVLIGCLFFNSHTGSELYVFELAKQLVKQGCEVTICSQLGDELVRKAKLFGINTCSINEPPGFKIGDGKWVLNTPQGPMVSQTNMLYKIKDVKFDIMHLMHKPITERLLNCFPNTDAICTIHSEVIALEYPVIDERIKKYIAIRPEIKHFLINEFDIDGNKIPIVFNPIDSTRFKNTQTKKHDKKRVLFVGTLDYLRRNTILDLVESTKKNNEELWLVGKENGISAAELIGENTHVTYFGPHWDVEKFVYECDETASILLGRTTIEGWLCGKPGWIYTINNQGEISSKELHEVPSDVDKFKSENVAAEIIKIYKEIL